MSTPLNILLVEDVPDDAELLLAELRRMGFAPQSKRVETGPEFLAELAREKPPDIIISDYSMPQFNGLKALELLQTSGLNIPFILISGTVGEDVAVEAMRRGATDYLLKDRMGRLGSAVQRALREAQEREELRRTEMELQLEHEKLRSMLEHNPAVVYTLKVAGQKVIPQLVSDSIQPMLGFTVAETVSREWWMKSLHPEDRERVLITQARAITQNGYSMEYRIRHKNGTYRWVEDNNRVLRGVDGRPDQMVGVWNDISERKQAEEVLRTTSQREAGRKKIGMLWDLAAIFGLSALAFVFFHFTNSLQAPFDALIVKYKNHLAEVSGGLMVLLLGFFVFSYRRWREARSRGSENAHIAEALLTLHGELEKRIQQRTAELTTANDFLRQEIAERQQAEASLKLFRTLIDRSNDAIEVVDPETGRFLDVNETACQRLGYAREELLAMTVSEIEESLDSMSWSKVVEEIRRTGFKIIDGRLKRKDGSTFPVEVNVRHVRLEREYLIAVVRDISERKQAEEAQRASDERFRELAENINEVFWITDPSMQELLYVNPAYEKIWGRTCESLYASPRQWLEAIHDEDRPRIMQAAAHILTTSIFDVEYRIIRPDQSIRWIHDRGFPIRNAAGEFYRIVGTAEDITGRKKIEAQFLQAQKMEGIGQLAGGVAHDFNNILMVIQMQADLLIRTGGLSAEQREFADQISLTVQRAAALTRQLLLFSRREVFQPRDLDLSESITNTIKMLRCILGENIQMQLKLASQPMFLHADAGMLDQVLMNLVVNARDAMPKGGQLVIETSGVTVDEVAVAQSIRGRPGKFVCLSVSDSGSGILPGVLPKIFEPFYTTKEVGKGTGLGLATVFGIVEQHEGWIDVVSEVGRGTTFRIYLPRLSKNATASASASATASLGGNEVILLVEDDLVLRVSMRKALSQLGYRILEAPTGVKALEAWQENREKIHLLLTDLVMPGGISGKELAERIRQENPKLKVIYMSGYSTEVMGKDFVVEEGVDFLTKPFVAQKLAQAVRDCLDAVMPH